MYSYQIAIMMALCLLCFNKASFWGAFTLYVAYCIYSPIIVPMSAIYYYSCAAFLNLIVGIILHIKYKSTAICSYGLVFVNLFGFWLWHASFDPFLYDMMSALILVIQLISLIPKRLLNGFKFRSYSKRPMVKPDIFNRA